MVLMGFVAVGVVLVLGFFWLVDFFFNLCNMLCNISVPKYSSELLEVVN